MKERQMSRIVGGKRYSTKTAALVAHDCYWDGHNLERSGRNTYLYRTARSAFFAVHLTQWQGERDYLEPLSREEAVALYEGPLTEHEMSYAEAFPWVTVEEAGSEPIPAMPEDHAPRHGMGLGHVRLDPPNDDPGMACRFCGEPLAGGEVWAEAVSNGSGGLYWTAPLCGRCKSREGAK